MGTRHRRAIRGTRKQRPATLARFQREIVAKFLEMVLMVKLFHWDTHSFAAHKASDDLYTKLNASMDEFVEVLLGKSGSRIGLERPRTIRLLNVHSMKREIEAFQSYLSKLEQVPALRHHPGNSDLYNIRDTVLGNLNQFMYLLTFK